MAEICEKSVDDIYSGCYQYNITTPHTDSEFVPNIMEKETENHTACKPSSPVTEDLNLAHESMDGTIIRLNLKKEFHIIIQIT